MLLRTLHVLLSATTFLSAGAYSQSLEDDEGREIGDPADTEPNPNLLYTFIDGNTPRTQLTYGLFFSGQNVSLAASLNRNIMLEAVWRWGGPRSFSRNDALYGGWSKDATLRARYLLDILYFAAGPSFRRDRFSVRYPNREFNNDPKRTYYSNEKDVDGSFESVGVELAIGNEFVAPNGFLFNVEWVRIYVPLKVTKARAVTGDIDSRARTIQYNLVNLGVGWSLLY